MYKTVKSPGKTSSRRGRFLKSSGRNRILRSSNSSHRTRNRKVQRNGENPNGDVSRFDGKSDNTKRVRARNNFKHSHRNGKVTSRRGGGFTRTRKAKRNKGNSTIDIAYFIRQASNMPKPKEHTIKHTFADFGFVQELQKNLEAISFETPTPIQDQSIPHIMDGKDVVGLANTGTGKTGAFMLPLIDKIARNPKEKVLVIAPTRELALQIEEEFRKFSARMRIFSAVCIGGVPIFRQINSLKRKPNVVIGTPGRLEDLRDRGSLRFEMFNSVVLDEVDRMLDMGFIDSIRKILDQTPMDRQSLFFSATMPPAINKFVKEFTLDPVTVEISRGKTAHNVEQDVIRVRDREMKLDYLKEILAEPDLEKVLIFSETKRDVERLTQELYRDGFKVDSIHGDKRQRQRQKSLTHFKNNKINILVATDVAARGLDIKDVTHVINYTVPQSFDDYIHRIGRTGRGSAKGTALTFV